MDHGCKITAGSYAWVSIVAAAIAKLELFVHYVISFNLIFPLQTLPTTESKVN